MRSLILGLGSIGCWAGALAVSVGLSVPANSAPADPSRPASGSQPASAPVDAPANPVTPADGSAAVYPGNTAEGPQKFEDPIQKLWEVPMPEPVLDAPSHMEGGAAGGMEVAADARTAPASSAEVIPDYRRDPITRTAIYNAQSNAGSFTDGVGGFGSAVDSAFLPGIMNNGGKGFVFGPMSVYPQLSAGMNYQHSSGGRKSADDGLHPTAGVSFRFSAGQPEVRRTVTIDYTGLYIFGRDDTQTRPFTQRFALRGNYGFAKIEFGLGITYLGLSGENRDLGQQSDQDLLTVALTSTVELTPKATVDLDLAVPLRKYSTGTDSGDVIGTAFLNFRSTPKTTFGVGVGGGLSKAREEAGVSAPDDQHFFQVLGRATVETSPVFSFSATVGAEWLEAGDADKVIPIFGLGATWTPRLGTSFTLTADRRSENSAANSASNYITTSVALAVTQRLGSKMQLRLMGGFEDAEYYSLGGSSTPTVSTTIAGNNSDGAFSTTTSTASGEDRHDQLYVGQVGLFAELNARWSAQLQYSFTKNTSNTSSAFEDTRAQFQVNFNF